LALPSFRFERRLVPDRRLNGAVSVASILLGLGSTIPLFLIAGVDPVAAFQQILSVFTTVQGVTEAAIRAIPIILIAVGLCLPFKMGFWNIGGEGQLFMGGFAATLMVMMFPDSPSFIILPLMILFAFVAGGIWGMIPAFLKARLQVNEVLTTLMMNFIAILWVDFLVYGPWRDPNGYGFPLTPMFPPDARLPIILGTRIHSGLLIAIASAVLLFLLLSFTRWGYEIKVAGQSKSAAEYAGMSYLLLMLLTMFLSGGFSGLAGMTLVSGIVLRLRHGISPGYGYTAIIVAWLARLNPIGALVVGLLFGGLLVSGDALQIGLGLAFSTVLVFQGLILLFIVGGDILTQYRIRIKFG
jgi:simple sugar transport system permease protein